MRSMFSRSSFGFVRLGLLAIGLPVLTAPAEGADLPEAPNKDMVEAVCTACHNTNQITRSSGYSRAGWDELTATMIDLSGDAETHAAILDYLADHFPPSDRRASTQVPGELDIAFQEWTVPTLGQRSRDPIEAVDGTIWWAGQWGNLVGRIDPLTGEMQEYPLPPNAMPHTVTLDAEGSVWYTGNKNGTVGRLDPETGKIDVFPMPDPAAKDPHSAIFDADGTLWFTLQHANMIGRLDVASGKIDLVTPPTADSRPYGIKIDAEGHPWVACNGSNCLLRVDPETMALTEIALPGPATTVRRLDIDAEGRIWYVNSSLGRLGRYDPASGEIKEWPSPSGPDSHPYAIAVAGGAIWYNESGVRPDMLVRFDPLAETFQSWPIPTGGIYAGIIRHMRQTADGGLIIHQSSTNRIIKVDIAPKIATQ